MSPRNTPMSDIINYIEFRRALFPLVLPAAEALISPTYAEGSLPSSSHFSRKFLAASYPFFWISSNLPNCKVPNC